MDNMVCGRTLYGDLLAELGKNDDRIVVLDADLQKATMTNKFAELFPDRYFNVGAAEQNMVGMAAGMAAAGKIPFINTFAIFLCGRAWEQIRNSICYSNLNVKLIGFHAGITVGPDGGSHQCTEDIALMRVLPNMTIYAPGDSCELNWAIEDAMKINGPCYIRLSREKWEDIKFKRNYSQKKIESNISEYVYPDIVVLSSGSVKSAAIKALNKIAGIDIGYFSIYKLKPFSLPPMDYLFPMVTIEEHSTIGGLGDAVAQAISYNPVPMLRIGIDDVFGKSGNADDLLAAYGLAVDSITKKIVNFYGSI